MRVYWEDDARILIGAGTGGIALIELFHDDPTVEIVGVADIDEQAAGLALARKLGLATTTNYRDLLADNVVDLMIDFTGDHDLSREVYALKADQTEVFGGVAAQDRGCADPGRTLLATGPRRVNKAMIMNMNTAEAAPIKPTISKDLLDQLDVRVGTIELVEDLRGSERLVRLTVNFGNHSRAILAGIKQERQNPKEIEGKQALFVINLESKKIQGEVSEGMLFDIGYADGIIPVLAIPEFPVPNGTRVG